MKWSHDYKRDVLHPNKTRGHRGHDHMVVGFTPLNLSIRTPFMTTCTRYNIM